ncbi:hypothetical protein quinque_014750 [Culex quinquefasciatus]
MILFALFIPSMASPIVLSQQDSPPKWFNNSSMVTLINEIFAGVTNVDIISEDHGLEQTERMISVLHEKTFRIFGGASPGEHIRISGCPLPAVRGPFNESISQLYDKEGDEEKLDGFIHWDQSYETFGKLLDQNQNGGYVVFANLSGFRQLMKCLLDPVGTYLVLLKPTDEYDLDRLGRLLRSVWRHRGVYRLYVLAGERIYTWDPFGRNGTLEFGVLKELTLDGELVKVPETDFQGYPLNIDMFWSTYSEPVDLNHSYPDQLDFGSLLPNGTFSGSLGRLSRRESDIAFVGFFIKDYFSRAVEFTAGVYNDELCCLVRKARRIPEYLLPFTIFPPGLWMLLLCMGLICAGVWIFVRAGIRRTLSFQRKDPEYQFNLSKRVRTASSLRKMLQICIDTYILLMSAPYRRFTRSGTERILLFGLMIVSLIFVSMFQSSLASVFVNPLYYKDINSLAQLDKAQYKIPVKYKGFLDDVFPTNYSALMESLRNRMIYEPSDEATLARVSRLGNIATVTRKTTLTLDNAIYLSTNQLHMIPECPRTYNLAYVVPRHSVLLERINGVLLRMLNGGLINHWVAEMNYNVTLRNWEQVRRVHNANYKVLTVVDMEFSLYLLAIGLAVSWGVFLAEQVHYWF